MKPLNEPARYKREDAAVWRPEVPPEDTAPPEPLPTPKPEDWGTTLEEARAMLERQMCPVCREGPWKSPLNHASRKHGISRFAMRDACGLMLKDSVTDPELRARFSERGKTNDMSAIGTRGPGTRKSYRRTSAGQARLNANIEAFNARPEAATVSRENAKRTKTPEAQAKRSATIRAKQAPA